MKNGLLYKLTTKYIPKFIIPQKLAEQVVEYLHVQLVHQGRNKLLQMDDRNNFYMFNKTKMFANVTKYCLFCGYLRPKSIEIKNRK